MKSNLAPVLIPTLNRYEHLKSCIDSLGKCSMAKETDVFIALDYPSHKKYYTGYKKVVDYLTKDNISFFKSITIFKREENYGAVKNTQKARELIFNKYDKLIVSEDDNVFACDFLEFINKGLVAYKGRKDILTIIGYQYPVDVKTPSSVYLYNGFSAWGYGTWKDKWEEKGITDLKELKIFLSDKKKLKKIKKPRLLKALKRIVNTGIVTGDTYLCYYQIKNKMYSVYPTITKVKNTGHDGSGIHGGNNKKVRDVYLNQEMSLGKKDINFPKDIKPDFKIIKKLDKYLNPSYFRVAIQNPKLFFNLLKNKLKG